VAARTSKFGVTAHFAQPTYDHDPHEFRRDAAAGLRTTQFFIRAHNSQSAPPDDLMPTTALRAESGVTSHPARGEGKVCAPQTRRSGAGVETYLPTLIVCPLDD
jgi:hypothetical protein